MQQTVQDSSTLFNFVRIINSLLNITILYTVKTIEKNLKLISISVSEMANNIQNNPIMQANSDSEISDSSSDSGHCSLKSNPSCSEYSLSALSMKRLNVRFRVNLPVESYIYHEHLPRESSKIEGTDDTKNLSHDCILCWWRSHCVCDKISNIDETNDNVEAKTMEPSRNTKRELSFIMKKFLDSLQEK